MKKITSTILALLLLLLTLISCTANTDKAADNSKVPKDAQFLVGTWERSAENDTMYFCLHSDGSFSFYCACGNPVGNADCYDSFEYLKDERVIRAFDSVDKQYYQDYKLYMSGKNFIVIDVNGEMMEFWLKGKNVSDIASGASTHCFELVQGFTMHRCMTDASDTEITLAPPYYDGDVKEHRTEKISLKLAKNVEIISFEVKIVNKDGEETSEYKHEVMTLEDMKYLLDTNLSEGFVWLNDELEVYKILFYGELYIWE